MVAKVIVFDKDGSIRSARVIDKGREICKENLTDFVPCPETELTSVQAEILEFCKKFAPKYLYHSECGWKVCTD